MARAVRRTNVALCLNCEESASLRIFRLRRRRSLCSGLKFLLAGCYARHIHLHAQAIPYTQLPVEHHLDELGQPSRRLSQVTMQGVFYGVGAAAIATGVVFYWLGSRG